MRARLIVLLWLLSSIPLLGVADTISLQQIPSVVIEMPADSLLRFQRNSPRQIFIPTQLQLPAQLSLQELLAHLPGLDVRSRGPAGTQADLSIRGGSFDQAMVLINGIDMTDAQTGHHTLCLPIRAESIAYVELLTGPAALQRGPGAFAGSLNIVTKQPEELEAMGKIQGGQHGLLDAYLHAGLQRGRYNLFTSVGARSLRGYAPNTDHLLVDAFLQGGVQLGPGKLSLQAGHQSKAFGANAFYSYKFPNQFEAISATFASLAYSAAIQRFEVQGSFNYRTLRDRFELFRDNPAEWYKQHNFHHSHLFQGLLSAGFRTEHQRTELVCIARHDRILSNTLGAPIGKPIPIPTHANERYDRLGVRTNYSATLSNRLFFGNFSSLLSAMGTYNTRFAWEYGFGASLAYTFPQAILLQLSASRAYRLPTFTDLYYRSPTQRGNLALRPENALSFELQLSRKVVPFFVSLTGHYRLGRNLIDWQQDPLEPTLWVAKNHARVNAAGGEINGTWLAGYTGLGSLSLFYAYSQLLPEGEKGKGQSYVLNNLLHQASLMTVHPLPLGFTISLAGHVRKRAGTYLDLEREGAVTAYPWIFTLDTRLSYAWRGITLGIEAKNLLNAKVIEYANIPQPGRWVIGSIAYKLQS